MAVGSDDGVAVWLNGEEVHRNAVMRGIRPDSDLAAVKMKAGENRLLVKVEQGGGEWKFCLRLLSKEQAAAAVGDSLAPDVWRGDDDWSWNGIGVRTHRLQLGLADLPPVKVEVIAPGGRPVAEKEADKNFSRGETAIFDYSKWPDGPYDIRCTTRNAQGRPIVAHVPWFKGDWHAAAKQLVQSAAKAEQAEGATPDGMVLAMLAEMVRDRLGPELDRADADAWNRSTRP